MADRVESQYQKMAHEDKSDMLDVTDRIYEGFFGR